MLCFSQRKQRTWSVFFTVTKLQTMTTGAPKRKKNASRKNKKSWRKNVDIDDVEEFLEEERLEERLGGKFADRKDEQGWVQPTVEFI